MILYINNTSVKKKDGQGKKEKRLKGASMQICGVISPKSQNTQLHKF